MISADQRPIKRPWPWVTTTVLCLAAGTAHAQAPVIVSRQPEANAVAAPGAAAVVVGFSSPAPLAAGLHVVGNRYGGQRPGPAAVAGNTVSLVPVPAFGPGELVRVTIPGTGAGVGPKVYEFTAATGAAAAQFGPRQSVPVGVLPVAAAVADLDGDGDVDLAVANAGNGGTTSNGRIIVYLNNGQGQFTANGVGNPATITPDVTAADVDLDGAIDLVYIADVTRTVVYDHNNGTAGFTSVGQVTPAGENVVAADFDGDGHPDFATVSNQQNRLTVGLYNPAAVGKYTTAVFTFGDYPGKAAVADLDGDGDLDLAISNGANVSPLVNRFLNNGLGQFSVAPSLPLPTAGEQTAAGDVNNDGRADLVVASYVLGGPLYVLRNLGGGAFAPPLTVPVALNDARYLTLADLNGDGYLDVAVASSTTNMIQVLLGNGTGQFTPGSTLAASGRINNLYSADLNGDRRLDLVAVVQSTASVNLFFNQAPVLNTTPATTLGGLACYPNPVSGGYLHIYLPLLPAQLGQERHAELYNGLGQLVQRVALPTGPGQEVLTNVDVHGFVTGLYTLRVCVGEATSTSQVSIE